MVEAEITAIFNRAFGVVPEDTVCEVKAFSPHPCINTKDGSKPLSMTTVSSGTTSRPKAVVSDWDDDQEANGDPPGLRSVLAVAVKSLAILSRCTATTLLSPMAASGAFRGRARPLSSLPNAKKRPVQPARRQRGSPRHQPWLGQGHAFGCPATTRSSQVGRSNQATRRTFTSKAAQREFTTCKSHRTRSIRSRWAGQITNTPNRLTFLVTCR